ncbi:efflux RND transporter periplasmic adaptor subunit [Xylanibacillus composti]|uniref:Efflux RND transporter periplasmic adaptor subunit n=1 Tax=Xylanibacillus composti TaxID=1572762 RepID=A0A8J4H1Q1_9BACL|nr:efflux RND transporter periplasmic adaptor subunit [Xylanibacillus composti]MDT9723931.1 efflux RND transporter periplasmic adaptor subunit [Xylanibacillus composti]GIQ67811.1 hypothetical protein XYCOK13_06350 [Xylanibacillus composti]
MHKRKAIILAAAFALLTACASPQLPAEGEQEVAAKKVKVTEVAAITMGEAIRVDAAIQPSSRVDIAAQVNGEVLAKHVSVGDSVSSGQTLVELDQADYRAALSRAQLAKEKVLLQLENYKVQLRENSSGQNTEIDMLQLSLREADLSIQEANRNLQKAVLKSPIAGVVVDMPDLAIGQQVNPGQQLVQVEQIDPLHVEAAVKEKDLQLIQNKESLSVFVPVLGQTLEADVVYLSPSASSQQGSGFALKLKIDNPEGAIRPGMSAQVILDDSLAQTVSAVPIASVLEEDGTAYVYTVSEDAVAVKTQVELGRKNKEYAEIVAGLQEHDRVVSVGQSLLADGDSVEIVE